MLASLRALLLPRRAPATEPGATAGEAAPATVTMHSVADFPLAPHLSRSHGLPVLDWQQAGAWVALGTGAEQQAEAWARCERAWLMHLQAALGPAYRLQESGKALLLSSLEPRVAAATLDFINRTGQRVLRVLEGIAQAPAWGHDILIVFDDAEGYYRYVSHYYPEAGEFAASSGMHIDAGCGHFVTVKADLRAIEPIIAHEMTHACLGHLPIPAWLNEGLAVNTEHRLSPLPGAPLHTPQQMHAQHLAFWGAAEIQQFWSGKSFLRNDEGNLLSYELARILVEQLSADWPRFRAFACAAQLDDGGAAAAAEHLQLDLGALAGALLEQREPFTDWSPQPALWHEAPERGAF